MYVNRWFPAVSSVKDWRVKCSQLETGSVNASRRKPSHAKLMEINGKWTTGERVNAFSEQIVRINICARAHHGATGKWAAHLADLPSQILRLIFTKFCFTFTHSRLAWTTPRLDFTTLRLIKTSPGLVKTTLGLVKSKPGLVKAFGQGSRHRTDTVQHKLCKSMTLFLQGTSSVRTFAVS